MASLHLFGPSAPSAEAFRQLVVASGSDLQLFGYSRVSGSAGWMRRCDLLNPAAFYPAGPPGALAIWVSFCPIWLLAPFMARLVVESPQRLQGLCAVVACSSSSAITKRFAANRFDRDLVCRLLAAEDQLLTTCAGIGVSCRILRPTLIYGRVGPYLDRNLSRLVQLMRWLPFLPLPSHTGLRQPIHATQLAAVTLALVQKASDQGWGPDLPDRITLGGDTELSYAAMLRSLQQALPADDPARRCRLLPVPSRLFHAAAAPLLLHSPKAFEAVLRIGADLAGFTPSHCLLEAPPQSFPVLPVL
jgi:hypothetical protein